MAVGRTENPVVRKVPAVSRLADFQRTWRATAGLTYEDLARATGWSAATLRNAASGRRPPSRDVVRDAVTHCGGPEQEAIDLWRQARYHQRLADRPRPQAPAAHLVRTVVDLAALVEELYEKNGAPSMSEMEHRTGGRLGHSTAHRLVTKRTIPADRDQFEAFLDAVEVHEPLRSQCVQAWDRVITLNGPVRIQRKVPHLWRLRQELDALRTVDDLVAALGALRLAAGSLTDQQISERSARIGLWAPGTAVERIMAGRQPGDLFFGPVLGALGVPSDEQILWRQARQRVLSDDRARHEVHLPLPTASSPEEILG
ncbi:helix-turn-helix domain-containing protein (plasmid) [Streptomyces murinus]|uniref:helix-turn-helix domain-containing protein n=1 Tax=Streptomyces murinus TaxID=33900 RepID=UPI002379CE5F|nr:helix-turn-helix transcriptional regulator [Streptomyces murinus]WDO11280.1 helix-turn-helix domain-containing protein [Streptomyces murinus]